MFDVVSERLFVKQLDGLTKRSLMESGGFAEAPAARIPSQAGLVRTSVGQEEFVRPLANTLAAVALVHHTPALSPVKSRAENARCHRFDAHPSESLTWFNRDMYPDWFVSYCGSREFGGYLAKFG